MPQVHLKEPENELRRNTKYDGGRNNDQFFLRTLNIVYTLINCRNFEAVF
jgi:uncharacterized protein YigA (DUF484 family)